MVYHRKKGITRLAVSTPDLYRENAPHSYVNIVSFIAIFVAVNWCVLISVSRVSKIRLVSCGTLTQSYFRSIRMEGQKSAMWIIHPGRYRLSVSAWIAIQSSTSPAIAHIYFDISTGMSNKHLKYNMPETSLLVFHSHVKPSTPSSLW